MDSRASETSPSLAAPFRDAPSDHAIRSSPPHAWPPASPSTRAHGSSGPSVLTSDLTLVIAAAAGLEPERLGRPARRFLTALHDVAIPSTLALVAVWHGPAWLAGAFGWAADAFANRAFDGLPARRISEWLRARRPARQGHRHDPNLRRGADE